MPPYEPGFFLLFHGGPVDRFLAEYESRFEREDGYFRPIVKEVAERYLAFAAEKPPPPAWAFRDLDMVADHLVEYFP